LTAGASESAKRSVQQVLIVESKKGKAKVPAG
jgi:hypothetical protein